jgi:FXSXX-COOH protein
VVTNLADLTGVSLADLRDGPRPVLADVLRRYRDPAGSVSPFGSYLDVEEVAPDAGGTAR